MGRTFCALLGASSPLRIEGEKLLVPTSGGLVVLGAHLGPWESGAAELARRGLRPAVIAAPWPRLPRTEHRVALLRGSAGVLSLSRGRSGWRGATEHLRAGGTVVVLVDSASGSRPGRRAVPFVDGSIGAPDALIDWARRQGASVCVAVGFRDGFRLHGLGDGSVQDRADRAVELLRRGIERRPSQWAWVHALASLLLLGSVSVLSSGCESVGAVPPLPLAPEAWEAEASGLAWTGPLPGGLEARFEATEARVRWQDDAPDGHFEQVRITLWDEQGSPLGSVQSHTGEGSWPAGPLRLDEVSWSVLSLGQSGTLPTLVWEPGTRFGCGGCALESLLR